MTRSDGPPWLFKVVDGHIWSALDDDVLWRGSAVDLKDGYIHLSTSPQLPGTLRKHYPGRTGLLLLWIRQAVLPPDALRWEPSRGGSLFPHLYSGLRKRWVDREDELLLERGGVHRLPTDLPD